MSNPTYSHLETCSGEAINFVESFDANIIQLIEQSVKIVDDKINKKRILVKIKSKALSVSQLINYLMQFRFPTNYLDEALRLFQKSDNTMFALDAQNMVYRVYFEKSIDFSRVLELDKPTDSIYGLKWEFWQPENIEYTLYKKVIATSRKIFDKSATECGILEHPEYVDKMLSNPVFFYFEVQDQNTPRKSICMPFPEDELYILDTRFPELSNRSIKYIQYGVQKDLKQFKTLYYPLYKRSEA
jgi:hypothetical protein